MNSLKVKLLMSIGWVSHAVCLTIYICKTMWYYLLLYPNLLFF